MKKTLCSLFNRGAVFGERCLTSPVYWVVAVALWIAVLTGCASHRPAPDERPAPEKMEVPGRAALPVFAPRTRPAFPLSTPAGSARRQLRKDARAAVPRRLGKGAVYAPAARQVVSAYKATAPTTAADSGAVVSNAAAGSQQQNVKGNGNTLTADKQDTTQEAPGVGATIAAKLTGPLGWVLGLAAVGALGYLVYLFWGILPRRRNNPNQA